MKDIFKENGALVLAKGVGKSGLGNSLYWDLQEPVEKNPYDPVEAGAVENQSSIFHSCKDVRLRSQAMGKDALFSERDGSSPECSWGE